MILGIAPFHVATQPTRKFLSFSFFPSRTLLVSCEAPCVWMGVYLRPFAYGYIYIFCFRSPVGFQSSQSLLYVWSSLRQELNEFAFSAVISACEKSGRWRRAVLLFEEAQTSLASLANAIWAAQLRNPSGSGWWLSTPLLPKPALPRVLQSCLLSTGRGCQNQWDPILG